MSNTDRPIGYWLKRLDRLIDGHFERQLSDVGLSRRQWQLLNLLQDGPMSVQELKTALDPFLQDRDDFNDALLGLVATGWADSQNDIVSVTTRGHAQFGLVKTKVAELRQTLTAGISPEDYQATVDVLARMTANLESGGGLPD
jgi:hypothetical protein